MIELPVAIAKNNLTPFQWRSQKFERGRAMHFHSERALARAAIFDHTPSLISLEREQVPSWT